MLAACGLAGAAAAANKGFEFDGGPHKKESAAWQVRPSPIYVSIQIPIWPELGPS